MVGHWCIYHTLACVCYPWSWWSVCLWTLGFCMKSFLSGCCSRDCCSWTWYSCNDNNVTDQVPCQWMLRRHSRMHMHLKKFWVDMFILKTARDHEFQQYICKADGKLEKQTWYYCICRTCACHVHPWSRWRSRLWCRCTNIGWQYVSLVLIRLQ